MRGNAMGLGGCMGGDGPGGFTWGGGAMGLRAFMGGSAMGLGGCMGCDGPGACTRGG